MKNKDIIEDFIKELSLEVEKNLKNETNQYMGWISTYIPEEIIMAAGFIPYRIMGSSQPISLANTYLSGNLNPFIKSCLDSALKGEYDFLKGTIIATDTDAMKRLYDGWRHFVQTPFIHIFDVPKVYTQESINRFKESILLLIKELENHFKIMIEMEKIKYAISICNKTRMLLTQLNDLRKRDYPLINGSQFLKIMNLAFMCSKDIINKRLTTLLDKLKTFTGEIANKELQPRILLTGSFQNRPWLLEVIENVGGRVVCEDMCTRFRYFYGKVNASKGPLSALVERYYLKKAPSARMLDFERRSQYLWSLVRDFKVNAVIYYILKFDDPYLFEFFDMNDFLNSNGIPVLRIETDHTMGSIGQIKTRVQAFIERLGIGIVY